MKKDHPHICLFEPEIPQNTGNIGRLAAATQSRLHLVEPFGFSTDDKQLRRAGLDYWPFLDLEIHDDIDILLSKFKMPAVLTTKGKKDYSLMPVETDIIVFGKETAGLPPHLTSADNAYKIPLYCENVRSLNLANSVSIVLYDLMQKKGLFPKALA